MNVRAQGPSYVLFLFACLGLALAAADCGTETGRGIDGTNLTDSSPIPPACDPDGVAPCPDDSFVCVESEGGGKLCQGQEPATPDDGSWDCSIENGMLVCRGDHLPQDSGDWTCRQTGEVEHECELPQYVPGDGAETSWDCWYEGDLVICESGRSEPREEPNEQGGQDEEQDEEPQGQAPDGGNGGCPPGVEIPSEEVCGDGLDNDCDGDTDEDCAGGDGPESCVCVPGAMRYCDEPEYCNWGIQHCDEDGMGWGPCVETSDVPAACASLFYGGFFDTECCVESGLCCQDYDDIDDDDDRSESVGACDDVVCE